MGKTLTSAQRKGNKLIARDKARLDKVTSQYQTSDEPKKKEKKKPSFRPKGYDED